MKRVLLSLLGLALLGASLFFLYIVGWLIAQNGGLNFESDTMVLNILWEGNELYILLAAYTLLAAGLTWAAVRIIKSAWQKQKP